MRFLLFVRNDFVSNEPLAYGDLIKINGDFEVPDGRRNYGGFDYSRHLKTRGIYGRVFATSRNVEVLASNQVNPILQFSNNIRNEIISRANELLPEGTRGLLIGILIRRKIRYTT